jgi:hypothetical protein
MLGPRGRDHTELGFHLLKLFHGAKPPCAADAAVFKAAFFESVVEHPPGVGPHRACLNGAGHFLCAVYIFGEDRSGQTEDSCRLPNPSARRKWQSTTGTTMKNWQHENLTHQLNKALDQGP